MAADQPATREDIDKQHYDLAVSDSYAGKSVTVTCLGCDWQRTLASGHSLRELSRFLEQHRQATLEERQAEIRKAELW